MNISDKVVCINAVPGQGTLKGFYDYPNGYLEHGKVYCIEGIIMKQWDGEPAPVPSVYIVGVPAFRRDTFENTPFQMSRFRKLEEIREETKNKQSVSIGEKFSKKI